MGLVLTNNVASLTAQTNLSKTNNALGSSLEKLSTGLKINRGADGPAALVISETQRAQIAGLRTAIDNTNKAVSLVQTGEGALNEINNLLGKVRGLVLDSANAGVNDNSALAANQAEISNSLNTITNIANQTQFGTKKLLDGSRALAVTPTGQGAQDSVAAAATTASGTYAVSVTSAATRAHISGATQTALTAGQETLTLNGVAVNFTAAGGAGNLSTDLDAAVGAINNASGQTGVTAYKDKAGTGVILATNNFGTNNKISISSSAGNAGVLGANIGAGVDGTNAQVSIGGTAFTGNGNAVSATTGAAAGVSVTLGAVATSTAGNDADVFTSTATITQVQVDASKALTFQIGANAGQTAQIAFADSRSAALGKNSGASGVSDLSQVDVTALSSNPSKSSDFLKVVDKAISDVTNLRGQIGAFQANTLQSNSNNLQTTLQNTTAAESVIRDTDFASEIANFTKLQTQLQAGSTVLGNANQITQLVAGLLRG